jgi:hypothetical protein
MIGLNYINLDTFYGDFHHVCNVDKSLCRKFDKLKLGY